MTHSYSIVNSLTSDVIGTTSNYELNSFERLFIALNSELKSYDGGLVDAYMACGCFENARKYYQAIKHHRKLGGVAWILGDLRDAEDHYSDTSRGAQEYRTEPDFDRLIRLAFFQEDWSLVMTRFAETAFSAGFAKGQICCGRSCVPAKPFLEMLAVAQLALGRKLSPDIEVHLRKAFKLSESEWKAFIQTNSFDKRSTIEKIKRRCPPSFSKIPKTTVESARAKGATSRAHRVLSYVASGDEVVKDAREHLKEFAQDGDERSLIGFVDLVTRSGVISVSHSVLFAAMWNESCDLESVPPDRMIRLYGSHPIMNRRHFGRLLQLKFEHGYEITGGEIVTGLFQKMASIGEVLWPTPSKDSFDSKRLTQFRDWAELRLNDWIRTIGAEHLARVVEVWRSGTAADVRSPFGGVVKERPATPRDMIEWKDLLSKAARWLCKIWDREIGVSQWVSENQLYQLLKRQLKPILVEQHARPIWIEPQHLDVFIPEASVAVEFMGEQHYRAIDFFGGAAGLNVVQSRDRRKQELCNNNGVELIYVRFDENIAERAAEIAEHAKQAIVKPNSVSSEV